LGLFLIIYLLFTMIKHDKLQTPTEFSTIQQGVQFADLWYSASKFYTNYDEVVWFNFETSLGNFNYDVVNWFIYVTDYRKDDGLQKLSELGFYYSKVDSRLEAYINELELFKEIF